MLDSPHSFAAVKLTSANVRLCLANTNKYSPLMLSHSQGKLVSMWQADLGFKCTKTLNSVCEGLVQWQAKHHGNPPGYKPTELSCQMAAPVAMLHYWKAVWCTLKQIETLWCIYEEVHEKIYNKMSWFVYEEKTFGLECSIPSKIGRVLAPTVKLGGK